MKLFIELIYFNTIIIKYNFQTFNTFFPELNTRKSHSSTQHRFIARIFYLFVLTLKETIEKIKIMMYLSTFRGWFRSEKLLFKTFCLQTNKEKYGKTNTLSVFSESIILKVKINEYSI